MAEHMAPTIGAGSNHAATAVELGYLGVTRGVDLHRGAVRRAAEPIEPLAGRPPPTAGR